MPLPAYLEIGEIPGSCKVQGRENHMEILGFRHEVYMPVDRKDGSASGTRVHKDLIVIKNFDKGSPKLYQYLCNGKIIASATLKWDAENRLVAAYSNNVCVISNAYDHMSRRVLKTSHGGASMWVSQIKK